MFFLGYRNPRASMSFRIADGVSFRSVRAREGRISRTSSGEMLVGMMMAPEIKYCGNDRSLSSCLRSVQLSRSSQRAPQHEERGEKTERAAGGADGGADD